jgi:hypothetical protein
MTRAFILVTNASMSSHMECAPVSITRRSYQRSGLDRRAAWKASYVGLS